MEEQEKRNKRIGWIVSITTQIVLLVLFYFIVAWKAPFPPILEYGIELGFETPGASSTEEVEQQDETSSTSGEVEPAEPVEEALPEDHGESEDVTDNATSEETVAQEESEPETSSEATEVIEEMEPDVTQEEAVVKPTDSDEPIEETPVEGEKQDGSESDNIPTEEPQTIDDRAIFPGAGSSDSASESASLSLAGWIWDFKPTPDDDSQEVGKIVYKIVVDEDGYLVQIETQLSTVSPSVERAYRQSVEKLTFSKTSDYRPASLSTGTITFIIKSR